MTFDSKSWSTFDQRLALAEGWCLMYCDGRGVIEIQRDDEANTFSRPFLGLRVFRYDEEAREFVAKSADLSSAGPGDRRGPTRLIQEQSDLLPSIPEGENYLWHTPRGGGLPLFGWRTRYWSFLLKLAKAKPSWTIQAQPGPATGPFHWTSRRLSVQEMCRLQTLPDGLRFDCGRNDAQRMLGNAVPALLAEVVAREIRRQLLGKAVRVATPRLLPASRGAAPLPVRVAAVPAAYRSLAGDHAAHPGEGRGSRARARLAA